MGMEPNHCAAVPGATPQALYANPVVLSTLTDTSHSLPPSLSHAAVLIKAMRTKFMMAQSLGLSARLAVNRAMVTPGLAVGLWVPFTRDARSEPPTIGNGAENMGAVAKQLAAQHNPKEGGGSSTSLLVPQVFMAMRFIPHLRGKLNIDVTMARNLNGNPAVGWV